MSQEAENKIVVKNLSKTFDMYNSPMDKLKEALSPRGKIRHTEFHALTDLSFNVKKGEILGIMGRNGAGKSTLLKIITGILEPTSGSVEVSGRISSLLELGTGFNMEYTGIENIYFYGTLMGFTKKQMDKKLDDIIKFAEIGDYIDQVVKTYSSGMFSKLAFSITAILETDIMLIDEVLSVGDQKFKKKSYKKMKELISDNKRTVVIVSHNISTLKELCDEVMWMHEGVVKKIGDPKEVLDEYTEFMK